MTPAIARRLLPAFVSIALLAPPRAPDAQVARRLWVLQPPDQVVAYDTATFEAGARVSVPPRAIAHPDHLRVSTTCRLMLLPPEVSVTESDRLAAGRIWIWDGRRAVELPLGDERAEEIPPDATTVTEVLRTPVLAQSEDALIWLENRFEKSVESGIERAVRVSAQVWATDLQGRNRRPIASLPASASCTCDTGVCSESCPEWSLWAPDGLVGEFFLLTSVVPGQLGSTTLETRVYRRAGTTWASKTLAEPIEQPLAASPTASVLVGAVPDGGCCGWENEGNDQLVLWRNARSTVVYDERLRYDNPNYDASFYPANARLAPRLGALAFTIASTAGPADEIRLGADGKPNDAERARVHRAVAELPAVEVVGLDTLARRGVIPRASLVGWLNERELLVVQDGRLVVYGANAARIKDTGLRVRSAEEAFLR